MSVSEECISQNETSYRMAFQAWVLKDDMKIKRSCSVYVALAAPRSSTCLVLGCGDPLNDIFRFRAPEELGLAVGQKASPFLVARQSAFLID